MPLRGLRVVELGGEITAGYATKLLAELGAEVVKAEPPGGDPLRRWSAAGDLDVAADQDGGLFRYLNGGKHAVEVDLDTDDGRARLDDLVRDCDVVIETLGAGALESRGVSPDRLVELNPALALVRVSDFGQCGPYNDLPMSPLVLQALSGLITTRGVPSRDPVQVGGRIDEYTVGSYAAVAALTALRAARQRAGAVTVDLAAMECLVLAHPYFMII